MPFDFTNITDTLNNVTDQYGDQFNVQKPESQINPITDEDLKKRVVIRIMVIAILLGIIAVIIYKKKKN